MHERQTVFFSHASAWVQTLYSYNCFNWDYFMFKGIMVWAISILIKGWLSILNDLNLFYQWTNGEALLRLVYSHGSVIHVYIMHFELFLLISLDFILNVEYKSYFEYYIANLNSDRVFRLTQTKKIKKKSWLTWMENAAVKNRSVI